MVTLKLYNFNKKLNSTARPASNAGTSFSGLLVDPCSILNPVIKLENVVAYNFNYAYIQEFDRYYFVEDWYTEQGFWFLQLRIDTLGTWKTVIGNSTQYVERSASKVNEYIVDTLFPSSGRITGQVVELSDGLDSFIEDGIFVLNITGSSGATLGPYACDWTTFKNFVTEMTLKYDDDTFFGNLADGIRNSIWKPFDHLGNVIWFPYDYIDLTGITPQNRLYLGNIYVESSSTRPMSFYHLTAPSLWQSSTETLYKHPQAATYGKYMNLKPFTQYIYHDSIFGDIELDPLKMIDKTTVNVGKITDPSTGLQIVNLPDGQSRAAQVGVLIPMENNSLNIGGILTTVAGAVASAYTGGTASALAGSASILSATDSVLQTTSSTSQSGSTILCWSYITISCHFWNSVGHDASNLGRAYCQTGQISTFSGYIKCNNSHIEGTGLSSAEIDMIQSLMDSGFYYE